MQPKQMYQKLKNKRTCPLCFGSGSRLLLDYGIVSCAACEGTGLTSLDISSSKSYEEVLLEDFVEAGKRFFQDKDNKAALEILKLLVYRAENLLNQRRGIASSDIVLF